MACNGGGGDPVKAFLPEKFWNRARDWTQYALKWDPLTSLAVAQAESVQVDNNSDFLVVSMACVVTTAADETVEVPFWPIEVRIRDSASGQNWNLSLAGVSHLATIAGRMADDGWGPHYLESPRWIERGAAVRVEMTNLEAADLTVWLGLNGVRIYDTMRQ